MVLSICCEIWTSICGPAMLAPTVAVAVEPLPVAPEPPLQPARTSTAAPSRTRAAHEAAYRGDRRAARPFMECCVVPTILAVEDRSREPLGMSTRVHHRSMMGAGIAARPRSCDDSQKVQSLAEPTLT